ncbi:cohesin domain-containing protein [Clostridioides difficile]|uniref:cohesin domain-containing protein n=1 Tax=Clostridioides difficile TaxID=1496 RepID=UPI003081009C
MKKKLKLLFSLVIMIITIYSTLLINGFAEDGDGSVKFLDTSNVENILESSYWNSMWRGENALLDKSYGWCSVLGKVENEYLGYDFQTPKKIDFYEIEAVHDASNVNQGYMVKSWELQGYVDETWESIHKVYNTKSWTSTDEVRRFNVKCDKEYSKYRILVKDSFNPRGAEIGRLRFGTYDTKIVLDVEPSKEKIKLRENITVDLTIDNISNITAEDIRIKYDNEKLSFTDFEEIEGFKLVKDIQNHENGELRLILASKGKENIVNSKKILLRLKFKGIKSGEALIDIIKGRVSDGINMEKDLIDKQCNKCTVIIEEIKDVNNSGEFTLLDLGIDARYFNENPNSPELSKYNTDISINGSIDISDLFEIVELILENYDYNINKY